MLQPHSASSCSPKVASPSADRTLNSLKAVPKVRKCSAFASAPLQCTKMLLAFWMLCCMCKTPHMVHGYDAKALMMMRSNILGLCPLSSGVTVMDHQNMLSDLLQLI